VLIRGNKIEHISATSIATSLHADPVAIDGGGRTLMPGLVGDAPMNRTFSARFEGVGIPRALPEAIMKVRRWREGWSL
jgi:hypothetical protein